MLSHWPTDGWVRGTVARLSRAAGFSHVVRRRRATETGVTSPDFPLELTVFFPGKHLFHFLVLKMKDFRNFVLHNCILVFDAEQVYLKLQVINLKNKEVT